MNKNQTEKLTNYMQIKINENVKLNDNTLKNYTKITEIEYSEDYYDYEALDKNSDEIMKTSEQIAFRPLFRLVHYEFKNKMLCMIWV